MLLVTYRSPLAAVALPRWVNAQPGLQAAVPALEAARLFRLVGAGLDVLRGFGAVMMAIAALSLFVALTHAVREREGDLAMLRMLGAPARRVAQLLACEALWLALLALAAGLVVGHGLTHLLGLLLQADRSLPLTGWWWSIWHPLLLLGAPALALLAVAAPVARVLRLDVTTLLQSPR
jgi:putative ABC transport system permease protein